MLACKDGREDVCSVHACGVGDRFGHGVRDFHVLVYAGLLLEGAVDLRVFVLASDVDVVVVVCFVVDNDLIVFANFQPYL